MEGAQGFYLTILPAKSVAGGRTTEGYALNVRENILGSETSNNPFLYGGKNEPEKRNR